ncbi:MAG: o-succinylbenzoate synthase, partial [Acidimicrobiia bacterium]
MPSVPIDAVEVREIALPFRTPFVTAYGRLTERRLILVRLRGDGLEGWGECAPVPGYSAETIEGAWDALTGSAASILAGLDSNRPEDAATVVATMGGQTSARAAVEAAVWDLHAKAKGVPLWRGLGGVRDRVPAGAVVDLADPPQALPELVGGLLEAGYLRVKLKISPGDDLGRLEAVRSAFPRADLCADANGAYSEADFDHLAGFDAFDLGYLEQPLAAGDLTGHARLADRITTPICLDESIDGAERARRALASGAARIINLKAGRVGGVTQALAV